MGAYHAEVSGEEIVQKKYNMQIFSTIIALQVRIDRLIIRILVHYRYKNGLRGSFSSFAYACYFWHYLYKKSLKLYSTDKTMLMDS